MYCRTCGKIALDYTLHQIADVWRTAIEMSFRLTALSNDFLATTEDFARLVPAAELEKLLDPAELTRGGIKGGTGGGG